MKIITESKLPKWMIFILPFRDEEYTLKGIIAPLVIFPLILMGMVLYESYKSSLFGLMITISIFGLIILIIKWLIIQVDILRILRVRLLLHYKTTKNGPEKLDTRKRLSDLCMNSKTIEA